MIKLMHLGTAILQNLHKTYSIAILFNLIHSKKVKNSFQFNQKS